MLLMRIGGLACALPITHVVETMRPLPIEAIAEKGALGFVRGIAVVRGTPIPVIDAAEQLGRTAREQARFVIVRAGADRQVALLVDEVVDVRALDPDMFAELPPLVREGRERVAAIGAVDRQLVVALEAGRVVPEETWATLARA